MDVRGCLFKDISQEEYNKICDDFKWIWDDWITRILTNENGATLSIPVKIV